MKLVIVESPKKCETIGHYLGSDYKVMASQGHIRDLSNKGKGGLGIDIEHGFQPDFKVTPGKTAIVKELQKNAKKADEVILATDPDREGEAISWHLATVLGLDVASTKRLQFHEITRPAILSALENPGHIDMNLVSSQETRRMYDRIIGFKLSYLLQKKMGSKSAGRVQSVTLKMICDNDQEIRSFVPSEYWTIEITVKIGDKELNLALDKVDGKAITIASKEEADTILARIGESVNLINLETVKKSVASKLPFTTSTMQQEAFTRFHFSTSKTQSIAQRLYEGKDINGEHVGLITYMRTDSTRLSPEFFERHAKPFILEQFGQDYVGHLKQAKNRASAQDAHEAIRPTGTHRTPEIVARFVEPDEAKLYRLIYDRALASCMSDKIEEVTTAIFETNGLTFKANGVRTLFKGYEAIYGDFEDDDSKYLPPLVNHETYSLLKKDGEQKFTKAPARYSEAKVVKMMEEKGIGRPSTYASTIQTLQRSGYITSKSGIVTPTEIGLRTTEVLSKYFPEIVSSEYTANMEKTLDEISNGEETRLAAMESFYTPFIEKYDSVYKNMPLIGTGEVCPKCGAPLVVRNSKYGQFVACSNYPTCSYIQKPKKEAPKETGEMCPVCGKPLVERINKQGKPFVACSGYPACSYIKGREENKKTAPIYTEKDFIKPCPSCKTGHLVIKQGKRVKFLGCTNFPKCRYHEWIKGESKAKE